MRQIAIYGKGGIGKSTTPQNLVAGLADEATAATPQGFVPGRHDRRYCQNSLQNEPTVLKTVAFPHIAGITA